MNSVDMMHNLISRAKNLNEYTVTTSIPEDFKFNGLVPFDMQIKNGEIQAKVYAIDFDEAVARLDSFLGGCK